MQVVGELSVHRQWRRAAGVGFAAWIGFLIGTAVKVGLAFVMVAAVSFAPAILAKLPLAAPLAGAGDPEGGVEFVPVLRVAAEHGYAGWVVIEAEQDPAKAPPLTYAKLGYANLTTAAERAGFAVAVR